MISLLDQLANFDCTRDNLMLLFSGKKRKEKNRRDSTKAGLKVLS